MMLERLLAWGLFGMLGGCTITATNASQDEGPSNTCTSDSDCRNGNCLENVCQTLNGQLESLLLEVTPTADSSLPHIPFLAHVDDVPTSGGKLPIALVRSARVTGHLIPNDRPGCVRTFYGSEGNPLAPSTNGMSLPITVTLTPRDGLLGLPAQVYLADATLPTLTKGAVDYTFELQVPAATYDVYVVPGHHELAFSDSSLVDEACRIPPQLFRGQRIETDTVILDYPAAATSKLEFHVLFPQSAGVLDGWVADIIEPLSGSPISSERVLADPSVVSATNMPGKQLEYVVQLAHSAVVELGQAEVVVDGANELVRLRPPVGLVAPTLFMDRSALGLFASDAAADKVRITTFTKFPSPVTVEGQMARRDGGQPVAGHVNLVSTEIDGVDAGIFAAFQATVSIDDTGLFSLSMPPGRYRVYGVPALRRDSEQAGLSTYEAIWDVPADVPFQAGRVLELPPRTEVTGQTTMQSAEIQVVAAAQSVLPFDGAFGEAVFIPRASAGLIDQSGRFIVEADPGRFDISVRPPESSGFAWFVRPAFEVQAGSPRQELGRLALPTPSLVTGVALVRETQPVPAALIRAYAYLDENLAYTRDPLAARSVIQVAQTRTEDDGAFRLLVPASITAN